MAFHRVLCPVDFSDFSRRALQYADALATRDDAELHVVHVLQGAVPSVAEFQPARLANESSRQVTVETLDAFVKRAGVTRVFRRLVRSGVPAPGVLDYAAEIGADLIVLGTHGRTGFERILLGSTAERVLHKATCPVLTIPHAAPDATNPVRFANILCAVDFSGASGPVVERALALARESGARLTLVHVMETMSTADTLEWAEHRVGQFIEARRQKFLAELRGLVPADARAQCEACERVEVGCAWRAILRVAQETDADVIVVGVQGRDGVGLLLFGSTTQSIVRQARCPVLTVCACSGEARAASAA